jgi:hypothetical protein
MVGVPPSRIPPYIGVVDKKRGVNTIEEILGKFFDKLEVLFYVCGMKKEIIMERTFTKKEVEAMCSQSYMRGMMVQYETQTKKQKPRKVFVEWVKQLIDECPVNKFK